MNGRFAIVTVVLASASACKTQRDAFCNKLFTCDPNAAQPSCGTTCTGKPMTCFPGTQLGGQGFCVEACDPDATPEDPRFTCLTSGGLLQVCHPAASVQDPSAGCPAGLNCYRTDLLSDNGICVDARVCTSDNDCEGDSQRNTCGATVARAVFPQIQNIGNLQCLQPSCRLSGSECPSGESCLANFFELGTVPDICVPNCDSKGHCPPNFACASVIVGSATQLICVPGAPGNRCEADQDCIAGSCFDTGAGFSECVLPQPLCGSDLDCAPLDRAAAAYVCLGAQQGSNGHCVALNPYHGTTCNDATDCPTGQGCFRYSPYQLVQAKGECRVPCDAAGHCAVRGGVPQVCLNDGAGGCYPGDFALPCTSSSECLSVFSCLPAGPDPRSLITSPNICSIQCNADADCRANPLLKTNSFCDMGICRLAGTTGATCERDAQCRSPGVCVINTSGEPGTCTS